MKKICLSLATLAVASISNASQVGKYDLYKTGYIDNQECFINEKCGKNSLGGRNPDIFDTLQWSNWSIFQDLKNREASLIFWWTYGRSDSELTSDMLTNGIPLKTADGRETAYRLVGFQNAWFSVQTYSCNWTNGTCGSETSPVNANWSAAEFFNSSRKRITISKGQMLKYSYLKMGNVDLELKVDKAKAQQDPSLLQVRNLQLPAFKLNFQAYSNSEDLSSWKAYFSCIVGQRVRLNDRKCKLEFDPSSVNFGQLSLTSSQSGKVGSEQPVKLKLNCDGFQWIRGDKGPYVDFPYSIGEYTPYINGTGVTHSVVSAQLSAGNEVTIDGKRKIGLTKDTGPAPNLYIEGDTTSNQECGSSSTLELGQLTANPNSFGRSHTNNVFNGSKDIYWRLCKKPGEVDSGVYTGSATISIDYK